MLILEIFINTDRIDRIGIHNIGSNKMNKGYYNYEVVVWNDDKQGWDFPTNRVFVHERDRGWMPLVKQVLDHLITLEERDGTDIRNR